MQPQQPYSTPSNPSQYEFITNPQKPQRPLIVGSMKQRILIAGAGLVVLMVIGFVLSSLLGGGDKSLPSLISVLQQQQSLVHLTTDISTQAGVASTTSASAATINLSVSSEKTELSTYFKKNSFKVTPAQLNARISAKLDAELASALPAGNYDSVYRTIMKTQLTTYERFLKQAYSNTKGRNGRALLERDYNAAKLLELQLDAAGS